MFAVSVALTNACRAFEANSDGFFKEGKFTDPHIFEETEDNSQELLLAPGDDDDNNGVGDGNGGSGSVIVYYMLDMEGVSTTLRMVRKEFDAAYRSNNPY